jgi:hypothetical protein
VKVTDIVPNGLGFWVTGGGTPRQLAAGFGSTEVVNVLRMPGRQIQYLSARPSMIWRTFDWPYFPLFFGSGQDGGWRLYHRGEQVTGNWNRYLLHPTPNVSRPGAGLDRVLPSASRAGHTLTLNITLRGQPARRYRLRL